MTQLIRIWSSWSTTSRKPCNTKHIFWTDFHCNCACFTLFYCVFGWLGVASGTEHEEKNEQLLRKHSLTPPAPFVGKSSSFRGPCHLLIRKPSAKKNRTSVLYFRPCRDFGNMPTPDTPCMPYLPTLTPKTTPMYIYGIHGVFGNSTINRSQMNVSTPHVSSLMSNCVFHLRLSRMTLLRCWSMLRGGSTPPHLWEMEKTQDFTCKILHTLLSQTLKKRLNWCSNKKFFVNQGSFRTAPVKNQRIQCDLSENHPCAFAGSGGGTFERLEVPASVRFFMFVL